MRDGNPAASSCARKISCRTPWIDTRSNVSVTVVNAPTTSNSPARLISWSSGKDSAFSLHEVRRAGEFDVVGALTTVTETFGRVSIHGVRQEILQAQCQAAGLPPRIVPIPYPCPNAIYEARMGEAVAEAVQEGISHIIFGDLFLADIKAYREQKLAGTGITPVFPLWQRPTLPLAQAMIASGMEAYLATVDLKKLPAEFAKGADVLVHECLYVPAVDRLVLKTKNGATLKKHLLESHTSTEDVGRIAAAAGVKVLVLSHFVPGDDPLVTDDNWTDDVKKNFSGRIIVAKDLMQLALPV